MQYMILLVHTPLHAHVTVNMIGSRNSPICNKSYEWSADKLSNWSTERRCDVPADVVFLMDASDSIKDTEWEQEKEFVSVLIDNLEVDRYAIHVGVIVYSTEIGQVGQSAMLLE